MDEKPGRDLERNMTKMNKELRMVRKAADNKYFHRDFHNIMNIGLGYVEDKYGADAVKEYLRQFALAYYAPLKEKIQKNGLDAIEEHLRDIYEKEEWTDHVCFERNGGMLTVTIDECPAVSHIVKSGGIVSGRYSETTKTVYEMICEGTPVAFEMLEYCGENGAAELVFTVRKESV